VGLIRLDAADTPPLISIKNANLRQTKSPRRTQQVLKEGDFKNETRKKNKNYIKQAAGAKYSITNSKRE